MTMHRAIYRDLEQKIIQGELAPGVRVPSEHELGEQYGVSRATTSKALNDLMNAGLIERRKGSGSFVSETRQQINLLQFASIKDAKHGTAGRHEILSSRVTIASDALLQLPGASPEDAVIELVRRKLDSNDTPVAIETHVLYFALSPRLLDSDLENLIILQHLTELGVAVDTIRVYLEPVSITDQRSELLGVPEGTPALQRRRELKAPDGRILETTTSLIRPDLADFFVEIPAPNTK